ncbi:hypothetical protein M9411_03565 [Pasteurella multocida]|uniref:hypothetical protein n=1 Tax=Pasteurella multocida TaxID=747 RepID=UPI002023BF7D|nr:hypothetical protein [Pasteurella multocida]URJ85791.1 hypothetical protein M9411_03565 [Pasteurella multocida]
MIEKTQAKKLYINKQQLENALGISLDELPTKSFSYSEPLADYLIPYSSMEFFDIEDCIALLVGEKPEQFRMGRIGNKYDFYVIKEAIKQAIQSGQLGSSKIIQDYCDDFNGTEFYQYKIEHKAIEKWAKHHGYKWELPPYSPMSEIQSDQNISNEIEKLTTIIEQLKAENQRQTEIIEQLKTENLSESKEASKIVDCDEFSIYGHKSENLEYLFKFAKRISEQCDIGDLHSYPEKKHYQEYFKKYLTKNNSLAEAFYKILTPEKVKAKGNQPKGIDTFQGFI